MSDAEIAEIKTELNKIWPNYNFGKSAQPTEVLQESLFKVALGYWVGSGSQSILVSLGLASYLPMGGVKITEKGRQLCWHMFKHDF